ncbi:ComEA family DNA-binding protein [Rubripirellula reticaptiva]|uniref:ComE operon protein 1 n=1 Tax=Rubripirellula reticaptiva TaxID=2528013 RepID=A0A5C6F539_9BACT|nr:helix-hairpin-helix domain-containing protein [Rubripirellula reticaptiva]TWU56162.1 ComE operon protein 1 [Rubripirellula reticaptiva]
MTERTGQVESPFAKLSVQRIVALLAVGIAGSLWILSAPVDRPIEFNAARPPRLQIDLNQAGSNELSLIPGVGPILADRIIADRDQNGDFASMNQLDRVYGIGPKTLQQLRSICVVETPLLPARFAAMEDE